MPILRTVLPPHQSEKFTLAEAMRAWRAVEAEDARRAGGHIPARDGEPAPLRRSDGPRVAADDGERG